MREQVGRFLGRKRWNGRQVNNRLQEMLLLMQATVGMSVFILDATLCSQQGEEDREPVFDRQQETTALTEERA